MKFPFKLTLVVKLSIILAVVACLVYANTLGNDYVMDDVMMITENQYVHEGFAGIPKLLTTHHLEGFGANKVSDYYRPLALVMFAMEYQFFGLDAAEGHFFNILFFAACVVALFLFLDKLFNGQKTVVAFVASLLFAVHPVHTEVVANIKSRDELMCFFFAFLALNVFIDYVRQGKAWQMITGVFLLLLAVLSKETVVTFIGVLPLVFFFFQNENKRRSVAIMGGILAVVVFFFFMWNYVQSRNDMQETLATKFFHDKAGSASRPDHLATYLFILGYHIRILFVPYPLNANYGFRSFSYVTLGSWEVLSSIAVYVALIGTGLYRLFKYKKDPWAFGILFYLGTLALYANIVAPLGQAMANRYEFFPSVGFCLLLALAFEKWILRSGDITALKKIPALVILLPVTLAYSAVTVARNMDWADNFTLVNADLPKTPNDYIMEYKVGLELQEKYNREPNPSARKQINDESKMHLLKSMEMNPDYTESHSDLGVAYLHEENFDSAEQQFRRVLELNSKHVNASINLATLFFRKKDFPNAIHYYRATLNLDSTSEMAWYNMGICYSRLTRVDSSIYCMKKVIAIAPGLDDHKAFGNVAIMYEMSGQMDSARKYETLMRQYFSSFHLRSGN